MVSEQLEREAKYDVEADFVLPALSGVAGSEGVALPEIIRLDSVYFDTADHALLARGVTLRCRTGDSDIGWQLKVPTGDARTEIRLDPTGSHTSVPAELAGLVAGIRRGRALRHIVTVATDRTVYRLADATGVVIVEVADDMVTAVAPGQRAATVSSWREIEAELGPSGTEDTLALIGELLTRNGAAPATSPNKVAKALGVVITGEEQQPGPARKATAGEVIRRYLSEQDDALINGDLTLRRGHGGIHSTRVATRRLRSTLRVFADYFDPERAQLFDTELSWYANLLGQVRDREVQRARFSEAVADLPTERVLGPVAARIEQVLLTEQSHNEQVLAKAMNGRRYLTLLRESAQWAVNPPFTDHAGEKAAVLRRQVETAAGKVTQHLSAGLASDGVDELHKARKAGKRARYAAELAHPVLGKRTKSSIDRYKHLQDTLGDLQDGVVAADLLRRIAAGTAGNSEENGFTYGVLYANELQRAEHSRQQAKAWTPPRL